jgi:polar amino acid transport system substrate-binding protein
LSALAPIASALAAAAFLPAGANDVITLTSGEWPPYLSQYAPHKGVASRIVSEAFAAEGVTVKYVFRPWKRAYIEAERGEVNGSVIWGPGPGGATRARSFYFSDPVIEGQTVFFHLKSFAFDWNSYADLANVKIGGTAGYDYMFETDARIKVDRAATDEASFRKLLAGRFQVLPSDLYGGLALLRSQFTPQEAARITFHHKPYTVTRYHLILSRKVKQNARYLALFNRGLKRLRESGKYAQYMREIDAGA